MADDPRDRSRAYLAAGVSFFDEADRILLVQPTYQDYWDVPGGYVETGETPAQAAGREVCLVFDGGTLTAEQLGAIRLQADELK